jgi:hypothetical protein
MITGVVPGQRIRNPAEGGPIFYGGEDEEDESVYEEG